MKIVCVCDAGVPEMLMQKMKGLPGCEVELYTEKTLTDIKAITMIGRIAEVHGAESCPVTPEMLQAVRDADAVVVHTAPVNSAVLDAAPALKYVGVLRTGVENVNVELCTQRGIAVYNADGRNAAAVADQTVAMMLCEMRNIARGHAALMAGKWVKVFPNVYDSHDMANCTVGILGVGKIGTMVARRLRGFGCKILGCDPFLPEGEILARGCDEAVDKQTLLRRSDFVTMHMVYKEGDAPLIGAAELALMKKSAILEILARGCDEAVDKQTLLRRSDFVTMHMVYKEGDAPLIGAAELALMKKSAILVNCARAGLVDTQALAAALREKRIGGAAVDVFDEEPLPEGHPFLSLSNVTLTPHSAGTTVDAFANSVAIIRGQFEQLLAGGTPRNRVN